MKKEYTGKTLNELLDQAAKEKDCCIDDLSYEVIEEKAGFLGLGKEVHAIVYSTKDIKEFISLFLNRFFQGIQKQVKVEITEVDARSFHINLDSDENGRLIGKNGQMLQAIHTVLKAAVSSEFKKRIDVFVDINGYKKQKYEKLVYMAKKIAYSVKNSKTDAILDPMPSDERKMIHQALANMDHISTQSEGDGYQRRLKILYNPGKETI